MQCEVASPDYQLMMKYYVAKLVASATWSISPRLKQLIKKKKNKMPLTPEHIEQTIVFALIIPVTVAGVIVVTLNLIKKAKSRKAKGKR